jgi:transposase
MDGRLFLEAVLWIARTSSPWRDLPSTFGKGNTVFKRYREWVKADVFAKIFAAVSDEPDLECALVDGTIVKVHRHGQGAKILWAPDGVQVARLGSGEPDLEAQPWTRLSAPTSRPTRAPGAFTSPWS